MIRRLIVLLMVFVLAACGSDSYRSSTKYRDVSGRGLEKTRPDRDPVRRIVLTYPYTKERLNVTYFHDGNYDAAAMEKINILFRDRHENSVGEIDPELIDYLVDIRKRLGLPPTVEFQILSGYRSPETNERLARSNKNVAKESFHMQGWAVDFRVPSVNGRAIAEIAKTMQRGGVAYYPSDNHLHVDLGNIRTWQDRK